MCCEWVIMGDIPIEAGRLAVLPDRCQDRHLRFRGMDGALWWRERAECRVASGPAGIRKQLSGNATPVTYRGDIPVYAVNSDGQGGVPMQYTGKGLLLLALLSAQGSVMANDEQDVTAILSGMRSDTPKQESSAPAPASGYAGKKAERQKDRVLSRTDSEVDNATDKAVDKSIDKVFDKLFGK